MCRRRAATRSRVRIAAGGVLVTRFLATRFLVTAFVVTLGSEARAETSFAVSWRARPGPPACVTEEAIRRGVEKKLERNPFADREHADIVIEGEESRATGRFRARLTQKDREGTILGARELDADSCESLLRTTVIVVALFIEPEGPRPRASETTSEAAPNQEPEAESTELSPPLDQRRRRPRARPKPPHARPPWFDLSLGGGIAGAIGLLPSASMSVRANARLLATRSRIGFEWSGGYSLPQTLRDGSVRGTFSAIDQQLRVCLPLLPKATIALDACGGGFWGAVIPATSGVRERNDAWRPLAGPLGALALELEQRPGALRLDLGLVVLPLKRELYYESPVGQQLRFYSTGRFVGFVGLSGLLTIL